MGLGGRDPRFWYGGRRMGRGGREIIIIVSYHVSYMFESGDFWREIEKFAQK